MKSPNRNRRRENRAERVSCGIRFVFNDVIRRVGEHLDDAPRQVIFDLSVSMNRLGNAR